MKELLMTIGFIFVYIVIGEFVYGLSGIDDGDFLEEIVYIALWPVLLFAVIIGFLIIKVIDPIIGRPIKFMKELGRKLGKKLWN